MPHLTFVIPQPLASGRNGIFVEWSGISISTIDLSGQDEPTVVWDRLNLPLDGNFIIRLLLGWLGQ